MRASIASRKGFTSVLAFKDSGPRPARGPVKKSSSSTPIPKQPDTSQQLVAFIQEWGPALQAERTKVQQTAAKLARLEQVLLSSPTAHQQPPVGLKLTAANTRTRWPFKSSGRTTTCSSSSIGAWSSIPSYHPASDDVEARELQAQLQQLRVAQQEVAGMLADCLSLLQLDTAAAGIKGSSDNGSSNTGGSSSSSLSNILPWPTAASPAAAALALPPALPPAAAVAPALRVPPVVAAARAADCEVVSLPAAAAAAECGQPVEQLVAVFPLDSTDSNTTPAAAAAARGGISYPALSNPAGQPISPRSCTPIYLRLPQQQQQYQEALRQGHRVVALPNTLSSSSGSSSSCNSLSVEELAWMRQEQQGGWCWELEQQPQQQQEEQEAEEAHAAAAVAAGAAEAAEPAVVGEAAATAVQADDSPSEPHHQQDDSHAQPGVVKVEVCVTARTQPGQRLLLVGSHPTLGAWDLGRAWKLRWSEGHVWRGCLELPADSKGLEFKAVLKSAESVIWEAGSNRRVQLQGQGGQLAVQYAFRQ